MFGPISQISGDSPEADLRSVECRPRLIHIMLLVAATAFGFVGINKCYDYTVYYQLDRPIALLFIMIGSPLLITVSLALLVSSLVPRRSPLSQLFRRPGFTVNWVTLFIYSLNLVQFFFLNPHKIASVEDGFGLASGALYWPTTLEAGDAVVIAWLTLALSRSWQAERSWLDRSGRVLGVIWIAAFVMHRIYWLAVAIGNRFWPSV